MAPTATIDPVTNLAARSATLNGEVNPDGVDSFAYFEYGTTIAYENRTVSVPVGSGSSPVPITANVALTPATDYHVRAVLEQGVIPVTTGALHTHTLTCAPGSTDSYPANDHQGGVWALGQTSRTQLWSNGSRLTVAWQSSSDLYWGREVWTLWQWKPVVGDQFGRILNFHNHPALGGWEPEGSGVSAVALDWKNGSSWDGVSGLVVALEANGAFGPKHAQIMTDAEILNLQANDLWMYLVMQLGISSTGTGYVRIGVQGEASPRVNITNAKTAWTNQTGYALWEGMYNSDGYSITHEADSTYTRNGRTLSEALDDQIAYPPGVEQVFGTRLLSNGNPSWTHTTITSVDAASFPVGAWA